MVRNCATNKAATPIKTLSNNCDLSINTMEERDGKKKKFETGCNVIRPLLENTKISHSMCLPENGVTDKAAIPIKPPSSPWALAILSTLSRSTRTVD